MREGRADVMDVKDVIFSFHLFFSGPPFFESRNSLCLCSRRWNGCGENKRKEKITSFTSTTSGLWLSVMAREAVTKVLIDY
jgi:hypothetical protein